jgi:restriction endonuclease Mrr
LREVDISIRTKVGQFDIFIALDCKDYNKPVAVKTVEEFSGLLEDIQATKGGIVSYHGFSDTAKKKAELKGIDLYRLIDYLKY